jgi:hypothetical protein
MSDQELAASVRRRAAEARAQLLELCRRDVNAFCEHVLRDDQTGEPIEQTQFHVQGHAALDKFKRVVIKAHPESGKALSLDTLIPNDKSTKLPATRKPVPNGTCRDFGPRRAPRE